MAELTDQQKRVLAELEEAARNADERRRTNGEEMTNLDKFSGAIGFDDRGRKFGEREEDARPQADGDQNPTNE